MLTTAALVTLLLQVPNVRVAVATSITRVDNLPAGAAVVISINEGPYRAIEVREWTLSKPGDTDANGTLDILDVVNLANAVVGNATLVGSNRASCYVYSDAPDKWRPVLLTAGDSAKIRITTPTNSLGWLLTVMQPAPVKQ